MEGITDFVLYLIIVGRLGIFPIVLMSIRHLLFFLLFAYELSWFFTVPYFYWRVYPIYCSVLLYMLFIWVFWCTLFCWVIYQIFAWLFFLYICLYTRLRSFVYFSLFFGLFVLLRPYIIAVISYFVYFALLFFVNGAANPIFFVF